MGDETVASGGLVIRLDADQWVFARDSRAVIGRSSSCDVTIDNEHVSRQHVELVSTDGVWSGRDLETLNGTQVEGEPVTTFTIAEFTVMVIGGVEGTVLTLETEPAAIEPSPLWSAPSHEDPLATTDPADREVDALADEPPPTTGFVTRNSAPESVEEDLSHLPAPPQDFQLVPDTAATPRWPQPPSAAVIEDLSQPSEERDPAVESSPESGPEPVPEAAAIEADPEPEPDLPHAGWFPDVYDKTQERYWTGSDWAEQWRPTESSAEVATMAFTAPGESEAVVASEAEAAALPPADWYPDPEDSTRQRYWGGQSWTDHYHPPLG